MSTQIKDYATALDSLAFACLHGDRPQQVRAANAAREMLAAGGHRVRRLHRRWFDVKVRTAHEQHRYLTAAHSSMDATLDALKRFEGQMMTVTVKAEGKK